MFILDKSIDAKKYIITVYIHCNSFNVHALKIKSLETLIIFTKRIQYKLFQGKKGTVPLL